MPESNHGPVETQAVALKAVTRIFAAWGLSDDEAEALLDVPPSDWQRIKAGGQEADFAEEQLLRISALVGIYRALGEFFEAPLATEWITRPNTGPLFRGRRPVDRMISKGLSAFLAIRRYLEALPENRTVLDGIVMHPAVAAAIKEAKKRGAAAARRILSAPDMLTVEEVAKLMGIATHEVLQATKDHTLLAVGTADQGTRFPAWQFDNAGRRRTGLIEALGQLGNGWSAFRFFAATYQGVTNRERLLGGDIEGLQQNVQLWVGLAYG